MKEKKGLLIIIVIFVLLMGGATVLYRQLGQTTAPDQLTSRQPEKEAEAGDPDEDDFNEDDSDKQEKIPAPDFVVYDADGNEARLTDFFGKPIVLNFWASWCGPCKMEMPDFHEEYLESGQEIQFLMVNMTTGRETMKSAGDFIEEQGYTFPVFYDTQSEAASAYGAYSLPTTFFIDAEGYVIAQATGAIDEETLQRGIDMIR